MKSFYQYLNEVTKKQLKNIEDHYDDRPFDNIFGEKLRVVVPLKSDRSDSRLINDLANQGYTADLKTGMATSKIETYHCKECDRKIQSSIKPQSCPKCQNKEMEVIPKTTRERTERIGTLLTKLEKQKPNPQQGFNKPNWKELLHWWEKNKGNTTDNDETGISIIISRSPIDIIRMSDHREFNSCHSPPGSTNTTSWKNGTYFHCAAQEARTGGAVAYAIRTADLKDINLQDKEIFKDLDRKIKGIEPLQRQKLKRWTDGKMDLLLPEPKTYGIQHTDFQETILDYLRQAQSSIVDFANPPDFKKFKFRGGSYQDIRPASTIWNNFFGTKVQGEKSSIDAKEEGGGGWNADRLEKAANTTQTEHEQNWKHAHAWHEIEEGEGEAYITFSGGITFEFDKDLFIRVPESDDLFSYHHYNKEAPMIFSRAIKDAFDFSFNEINVNEHNNKILFNVDINHEMDGQGGDQPATLNEFESMLDELDDIDKDYNKYFARFTNLLIQYGYLKDWTVEQKLTHFKIDRESDEIMAISENMWIGDLQGVKTNKVNRRIKNYQQYAGDALVFDPTVQSNAGVIFPFNTIPPTCLIFSSPSVNTHKDVIDQPYKLFLRIEVPLHNKRILHTIQSIDQRFDYYEKRAIQWWNHVKPMLCGDEENASYSPKIPFARKFKPIQTQTEFDFEEWLMQQEMFYMSITPPTRGGAWEKSN